MFAAALAIAALVATAPPDPASAGNGVVAVALSPDATTVIKESLYRLKGEALSVGLEVRFIQTELAQAPLDQLDMLTRGLGAAAVVAFTSPSAPASDESKMDSTRELDVWFLDRSSGKTSVTRLKTDEGEEDRADVILAVRAVDFIRARMFDTLAHRLPPRQSAPAAPPRAFVAVGASALHAFSGFSAAIAPTLRLGYALKPWIRVEGEATALGSQATYEGVAGNIRLSQRFFGLGIAIVPAVWTRAHPVASAAIVHYQSTAKGVPADGYQGQDPSLSTLAAKVAVGLVVPLSRRFELAAKGGTLWLSKIPRYLVVDERVASVGRPTYTVDLTLGVAFR